jgi:hypothetical protein
MHMKAGSPFGPGADQVYTGEQARVLFAIPTPELGLGDGKGRVFAQMLWEHLTR